jgi:hypothetical protein
MKCPFRDNAQTVLNQLRSFNADIEMARYILAKKEFGVPKVSNSPDKSFKKFEDWLTHLGRIYHDALQCEKSLESLVSFWIQQNINISKSSNILNKD